MYWPTEKLDFIFFLPCPCFKMLSNRKEGLQNACAEQVLFIPVGGFIFLLRITGKHVLDINVMWLNVIEAKFNAKQD